mgnify:CR=1 FL=1
MSRRSSTATCDFSPDEMRRFCHPDEYPCYNSVGVYKPMSGCRERCCILPPGTPGGEDSPKWKETLAARKEDALPMAHQEGASPLAQPNFDSPKKTFTHDKSSGITPPDVRGEERDRVQAILRASKGWETAHPGIPGKRKADAIDVEEYA